MRIGMAFLAAALLSGCVATTAAPPAANPVAVEPVTVKIVAFNDFHGHLEPSGRSVDAPGPNGENVRVPAGGVAWLASAVAALRAENTNTLVVSAGDMIGASPLASALFLDEPTIHAMNLVGVDFNAAGNHEFDRGSAELLRMQNGGCEKHTRLDPCQLEPFPGARFGILTANTMTEAGTTLFPGTAIRSFGSGPDEVKVGIIGMTLEGTGSIVSASGVAGLRFADEAETANALVPRLKAEGVDAIVVLIHEGARTEVGYNDKSCAGLGGDLLPILDKLDPAVDLVISGHTHRSYVCDYGRVNPARPFLVTSAGLYGTLLTDITLTIDPVAGRVVARSADNRIVQSEGSVPPTDLYPRHAPDPAVAALVARYVGAAKAAADRPVGKLAAPARRAEELTAEQVLGDLIADAQLAATRAPDAGGAQIAFMNPGGVRADLTPDADGTVTFGDIYAAQPFGNLLVTRSFTGRQLRDLLEQQFDEDKVGGRTLLLPSSSLRFGYDLSRPRGQRVIDPRVDGAPIEDSRVYRVTMSNFLADGGDGFTAFRAGTDPTIGMSDVDALELYIAAVPVLTPPVADRTRDVTPR